MVSESSSNPPPDSVPSDTFRVLVTGDRHWDCAEIADRIVRSLRGRHGARLVIVHGAAAGVDAAFQAACERLGVTHEPHPADWSAYGRGAGPRRNQAMVRAGARFAIAVHRELAASRGTRDCVKRCRAAQIPVYLVDGHQPPQLLSGPVPAPQPPLCPVCETPAVHRAGSRWTCVACSLEFCRDVRPLR
jgi:hypothetical protein